MKRHIAFWLAVLLGGWVLPQVTPRQYARPTQDEAALRGAATYWIEENPNIDRRILEELAAKLEHDIPVKPADSRDAAGMVIWVDLDRVQLNPFGLVIGRTYFCRVHVGGVYIWRFEKTANMAVNPEMETHTISYALGWHVVKKWKKANK